MSIPQLASRIDAVKIYSAGATITRVADLNLASRPEYVEIAGLPLALDDSSVRARVVERSGEALLEASALIATDIRIGLAVPPPAETPNPPPEEELHKAKAQVRRLEDAIALIRNEITTLKQLQVPDRPAGEPGKAPPPSPLSARLALANFSDEQIRVRIQEKRETQEKLRKAQEHLEDLQQKHLRASSAREVRPNELRKTVVVRLSYENTPPTEQLPQLVVEYFVPGARWTPTYVCRLNSTESTATIAVRAFICQHTGEDWSGVRLELSTAEPMAWCALPELPSLRIGRQQPIPQKSGWRRPPIGAELLFEDYDRQKKGALADVRHNTAIASLFSPQVPPLLDIVPTFDESFFMGAGAAPAASAIFEEMDMLPPPDPASAPLQERLALHKARKRAASPPPKAALSLNRPSLQAPAISDEESANDLLAYSLMRMGASNDRTKRGKLSIEQQQEVYLEILQRQKVVVTFDVMQVVQQAVSDAHNCASLPSGGISVRNVAGSFDYAYSAHGRIDVRSDGQFHSVALSSKITNVDVRYIVVPREDTNVFRIAQLHNPLSAPLLAGPTDVYVDGDYILSTNITTVPPLGHMELGLGVEQAIKVARNTFYEEVRSGETIVAFNELRHKIKVDITNHLPREARIEVRERLPIPDDGAKVDVQIQEVAPAWEKYEQEERQAPIRGGYCWRVTVPAKEQTTLSVDYVIKTFVDSELVGGNRRDL